jgi:hypothetical protein
MAKFLKQLMQNELSVRICNVGAMLYCWSATVIVASLMVCLSVLELTRMCIVASCAGDTTAAPRMGLPVIWDPSVYR